MKFGQKADTHGIMFALTRQMIIDDDLGALSDIPRQIGMGAAEALADAVWGLLLSNPTQSDSKTFFHADHKNYLEGADTVLDVDGLTKATGGGTAIGAGVSVYWDVADEEAKEDSEAGANKLIGKTILAAADNDTTVRVRMNQ